MDSSRERSSKGCQWLYGVGYAKRLGCQYAAKKGKLIHSRRRHSHYMHWSPSDRRLRSANTCSIWSRCPRAKLLVSTDIRAAIQDEAPPTDGTNVGAVSKRDGHDAPQLLLCETRRSEEHLQVSGAR